MAIELLYNVRNYRGFGVMAALPQQYLRRILRIHLASAGFILAGCQDAIVTTSCSLNPGKSAIAN
jgi:hypothetical protein